MSEKLLISFVIPAYNVERYISKTLGSLLSQTDKDFEIIVVDDGSTDNTYNVAKGILEKSGFSNYTILRKPNGGVSSARNMGIKHAKGKYIIFLDGDDYVSPELVEKVKEVVSKSDLDMVCWKFLCVDETGKPTKYQFPQKGLTEGQTYNGLQVLEKILVERSFWIAVGSAAYSRELINQNNLFYDERFRTGQDLEFCFKYLANGRKIRFIDVTMMYYVQRVGSTTKTVNFKRYDSYFAIVEVQNYFFQKFGGQKNETVETSKLLKALEEHAISHFLYWLMKHGSASKWPFYKKLSEEIDTRHPGLMNQVLSKARNHGKIIKNCP